MEKEDRPVLGSSREEDEDEEVVTSSEGGYGGECDYRGLDNMGATDHVNCIAQILFMTPEFRLGLYRWTGSRDDYEEEDEEVTTSVPLQLQRLFARLQFGRGYRSISAKALIDSFGWDNGQVYNPSHDVIELWHSMLDSIAETSEGQSATDLFRGQAQDYVRCSRCGYESVHRSPFFALSLDIHDSSSLEEALGRFLTPETLSSPPQWRCTQCNELVDCQKGTKVVELPYVITFHLQRLQYDWESQSLVKLNHAAEFPDLLDMAQYAESDRAHDELHEANYELYSVLVHIGAAGSGHHYAYIKSFEKDRWYMFNDTRVVPVPDDEVKRLASGGGPPHPPSCTPYMLGYRRIDPKRNTRTVPAEHVSRELQRIPPKGPARDS